MFSTLLPAGFNLIPGGIFQGIELVSFGFKRTPVTNQEYGEVGRNQFILLHHDWNTGESALSKIGRSVEEVMGGPVYVPNPDYVPTKIQFDRGDILVLGPAILLQMAENPYNLYMKDFAHADQPAVRVSYFHAKTWCLLKTLESGGEFLYDLPTDAQYEYVASDRGTKDYGTETGALFKGKKKLAHIDEDKERKGTTVAVDDPRYEQDLPFGVQTTGNVWRWTRFNADFKRHGDYFFGPYGWRGGSWYSDEHDAHSAVRRSASPCSCDSDTGFSPVVVRQDSRF